MTILLGSLALQLLGAWQDSPTRDEPSHLVDGLAYWQVGTFEFNYPHPPLAKIGPGLVLYLAGARIDTNGAAWKTQDTEAVNAQVLYAGRSWTSARWLVFIARLPMLVFWFLLVWLLWWWVRRQWGDIPALVATTIIAFDPVLLGHGHLVNTDVPVMAMMFATILAADAFFRRPSNKQLVLLSVVFGLAQLTKFSAVYLWPVIFGLGFIKVLIDRQHFNWKWWWKFVGTVTAVTILFMCMVYQFDGLKPNHTIFPNWTATVAGHELSLPLPSYVHGLYYNFLHNESGHRTVFHGRVVTDGSLSYFPTALATKTPLPTLGLWLVASLIGLAWLIRHRSFGSFRLLVFAVPVVLYGTIALNSNLNIGVRYIFPLIPFGAMLVGWAIHQIQRIDTRWTWSLIIAAASVVPIAIHAYPNTIAYFNATAGGSANGQMWFIDSNLDWGQDAWRVRDYLDHHPVVPTNVTLFGTTPYSLIAPGTSPVPTDKNITSVNPAPRVLISDGMLDAPDSSYQWILGLNSLHEVGKIGSTVHVLQF